MINEGKATAILLGIPLSLVAPPVLSLVLSDWASPLLWPLVAALFGVAGAALGYGFPADGWRLGPCLGFIQLCLIPFGFFLPGDALAQHGASVALLILDAAAFAAPAVVACLGAAVGALVKEHRSAGA